MATGACSGATKQPLCSRSTTWAGWQLREIGVALLTPDGPALAARHGRRGRIEARCGVVAGSPTSCRGHVVTRRHPIDGAVSAVARRCVPLGAAGRPLRHSGDIACSHPLRTTRVRRVDPGRSITANDAERAACRSRAATICWIASGGYSRSAMRSPASGYTTCRSSTRRAVTASRRCGTSQRRSNSSPASLGTGSPARYWRRPLGAGAARRAGWFLARTSTTLGRCCLPWLGRPSAPSFPATSVRRHVAARGFPAPSSSVSAKLPPSRSRAPLSR